MVTEAERASSFPDVEVNGIQAAIHLMDFHRYIDLASGRWWSCLDTDCLYGSCLIDSMTLFCILKGECLKVESDSVDLDSILSF